MICNGVGATFPDIAGFDLVRQVGFGGLGDVFAAVRRSTGGTVAIKILREQAQAGDIERRIQRELGALLALKGHPAVIQIEEVIDTPTGPGLVMEFASGGSVHDIVEQDGPLDAAAVSDLGAQVAALLTDAHALGIIHRDIKPRNILRTSFDLYKVCDFGIAAIVKAGEWADQTSAISVRYASPEERHGSGAIDASDVFSLGVTLLEARTGSTEGMQKSSSALWESIDDADERLRKSIAQMVADSPDQRPTASQVRDHLDKPHMAIDESNGITLTRHRPTAAARKTEGLPAPAVDGHWWNG